MVQGGRGRACSRRTTTEGGSMQRYGLFVAGVGTSQTSECNVRCTPVTEWSQEGPEGRAGRCRLLRHGPCIWAYSGQECQQELEYSRMAG